MHFNENITNSGLKYIPNIKCLYLDRNKNITKEELIYPDKLYRWECARISGCGGAEPYDSDSSESDWY